LQNSLLSCHGRQQQQTNTCVATTTNHPSRWSQSHSYSASCLPAKKRVNLGTTSWYGIRSMWPQLRAFLLGPSRTQHLKNQLPPPAFAIQGGLPKFHSWDFEKFNMSAYWMLFPSTCPRELIFLGLSRQGWVHSLRKPREEW